MKGNRFCQTKNPETPFFRVSDVEASERSGSLKGKVCFEEKNCMMRINLKFLVFGALFGTLSCAQQYKQKLAHTLLGKKPESPPQESKTTLVNDPVLAIAHLSQWVQNWRQKCELSFPMRFHNSLVHEVQQGYHSEARCFGKSGYAHFQVSGNNQKFKMLQDCFHWYSHQYVNNLNKLIYDFKIELLHSSRFVTLVSEVEGKNLVNVFLTIDGQTYHMDNFAWALEEYRKQSLIKGTAPIASYVPFRFFYEHRMQQIAYPYRMFYSIVVRFVGLSLGMDPKTDTLFICE